MALTGRTALLALAGAVVQLVAPGRWTLVGWLVLMALLVGLDLARAGAAKSVVWQRTSPGSLRLGGSAETTLTVTNTGSPAGARACCATPGSRRPVPASAPPAPDSTCLPASGAGSRRR